MYSGKGANIWSAVGTKIKTKQGNNAMNWLKTMMMPKQSKRLLQKRSRNNLIKLVKLCLIKSIFSMNVLLERIGVFVIAVDEKRACLRKTSIRPVGQMAHV